MFTLLNETTRTARTPHRCIWCPEPIKPGDKYVDERSIYDGDFQHHHWHPECKDACDQACRGNGGEIEIDPHQSKRGSTEES